MENMTAEKAIEILSQTVQRLFIERQALFSGLEIQDIGQAIDHLKKEMEPKGHKS